MSLRLESFLKNQEFVKNNISKSISMELDILYKWVFRWTWPKEERTKNKNNLLILISYNLAFFFLQLFKCRFVKRPISSQFNLVTPFLEDRMEHFILLFKALNRFEEGEKKVVILTTRKIFFNINKHFDTDKINFIFVEDNLAFNLVLEAFISYSKMFFKLVKLAFYLKLNLHEFGSLLLFYKKLSFDHALYKKILTEVKPKKSFSLSLDLSPGYIRAAKNITKIILQHGIGPASGMKIEANRSDVYMVWGESTYKDITNNSFFPYYLNCKVVSVGSPRIDYFKSKSSPSIKNKGSILFISTKIKTSTISYSSIEVMSKVMEDVGYDKGYKLIYKLHPAESLSDYSKFFNSGKFIDSSSSTNIYDLIANCSIVIGTVSTAILESIEFDKPVIQFIPEKFLHTVATSNNYSNIGVLSSYNKSDLISKIKLIMEDEEFLRMCLKNQKKASALVFGDYKHSVNNILGYLNNDN